MDKIAIIAALFLGTAALTPAEAALSTTAAIPDENSGRNDTPLLLLLANDILIERTDGARSGDHHLLALLARVTGGGANAPQSGSVTLPPTEEAADADNDIPLSVSVYARRPMGSSYTGLGNSSQLIAEPIDRSRAYLKASWYHMPAAPPQADLQLVIPTGSAGYVAAPSLSVSGSSSMVPLSSDFITEVNNGGGDDVEQIPVPAAAYLLGSGLLGLAGLRRKLTEPVP